VIAWKKKLSKAPFQVHAHVADQRRLGPTTSHHGLVYYYTSYWKGQGIGFNGELLSTVLLTLGARTVNDDSDDLQGDMDAYPPVDRRPFIFLLTNGLTSVN